MKTPTSKTSSWRQIITTLRRRAAVRRRELARVACLLLAALVCATVVAPPAYACSYCSPFGFGVSCCGDVGQASCAGTGTTDNNGNACNYACKDGLYYNSSDATCQSPPSCGYGYDADGDCCGAQGEVECDGLEGFNACGSGLSLQGGTCQPNCSYCSPFGLEASCCGDLNQASCAGTGTTDNNGNACNYSCKDGLYYDVSTATCQTAPSCTYGYSVFGTCCGNTNEVICLAGSGFDSCGPGLEYDANTLTCQPDCSYCDDVGFCCGNTNQTACLAGSSGQSDCTGNGGCASGLHFDSSQGTCQPPCSWGQSSVGTCCGDVGQVHCDLLSGYDDCKPSLAEGWFTCETPRLIGEICGPDYPCTNNLNCDVAPDVTTSNSSPSGLQLRCSAGYGSLDIEGSLETNLCAAFYSSDLAQAAEDVDGTLNFGVGQSLFAGLTSSSEEGVFYTEDGLYGCYLSACEGVVFNAGVDFYFAVGWADSYDDFTGTAFVDSISFDIVPLEIVGIQLNYSLNSSYGNSPGADFFSSVSGDLTIGEDVVPFSAGATECYTTTLVVNPPANSTPPVALCKNAQPAPGCGTTAAPASVDAGSYSPVAGVTVTETQVPPGPYPIGVTTVTNIVTDSGGLTSTCTATVTVLDNVTPDTTPPVLTPVGVDLTIQCPQSPYQLFTNPLVADDCDPNPTLSSTDHRMPGSCPKTYILTRTWTAKDSAGNVSLPVSQTITVVDTIAPVVSGQGANQTIQAPATPVFTAPTARDNCDPSPAITYKDHLVSGACPNTYSLTRTWTAEDCSGNVSIPVSQTITVEDTNPPVIASQANITVIATNLIGAAVNFDPAVTDTLEPSPVVTYSQNPGTIFAIGTNIVTITATDCSGNTSSNSFAVIVQGPETIGLAVQAQVQSLELSAPNKTEAATLKSVLLALTEANQPGNWLNSTTVNSKDGVEYFHLESLAVTEMFNLTERDPSMKPALMTLINHEGFECRIVAESELPLATVRNRASALNILAEADAALAKGNILQAIFYDEDAWVTAAGQSRVARAIPAVDTVAGR